jgi:Uma2 family endonuclease
MGMPLTHRRFTVDEYHRMAETGILGADERVELLDGYIVPMSPIGARHAGSVNRLTRLLVGRLGETATVGVQNPVILNERWEPQPDIAVLAFRPDDYVERHPGPDDILLIVEVADSSTYVDRRVKLPSYAAFRVPEVWLVNLEADRVEIYLDPVGNRYRGHRIVGRGPTAMAPVRLPHLTLTADELLGPAPAR